VEAPRAEMMHKTEALQRLFLERVLARKHQGLSVLSPADGRERGAHLALRHKQAAMIIQEIGRLGVIADFRPPDVMRFAFAPYYTSFADTAAAADLLVRTLLDVSKRAPAATAKVT
jgi:kynureninase